jgi:hypothetical protein
MLEIRKTKHIYPQGHGRYKEETEYYICMPKGDRESFTEKTHSQELSA